jgi:arabinogalactan endo-1,4-beta-galactosidase
MRLSTRFVPATTAVAVAAMLAGCGSTGESGGSASSSGADGQAASSSGSASGSGAGSGTSSGSSGGHSSSGSGSGGGSSGDGGGGAPEAGTDARGADAPSDATTSSDAGTDASAGDSGAVNPPFLLGADITWTQQDVAGGATYVDNGVTKPILTLLKDHGFNYIRLRTFVDPTQSAPNPAGGTFTPYSTQGFGDIAHTVAYAQQIKAAGMGLLLDFHFSDTWADPGKQVKPAAWASDNLAAAVTHLHDYTKADIQALVAGGGRPDIVQLGNEITPGMLLSPGTALGASSTAGWPQLAQLLKAGIAGVHEVDPAIKIMLHIDRGGDLSASVAFINNAIANGVTFDIFGESCYVAFQGAPSGWQTTFNSLASKFPNLKFVMAEYNADPNGQTDNELRQANDIVFNLPNHQGMGTFFWEPTRRPNAQNPGIFTSSGNVYTAIPACIDQYDQMKTAYGL